PDAGLRLIAEANGVPAKALRGAVDVAALRALRAVEVPVQEMPGTAFLRQRAEREGGPRP
ncbi:MAG: hypothetical protein HN420_18035, partial [Rhodospirillaceae bacterium]|nr:hypothetical protein [Rhodospirillaceae bacterium]